MESGLARGGPWATPMSTPKQKPSALSPAPRTGFVCFFVNALFRVPWRPFILVCFSCPCFPPIVYASTTRVLCWERRHPSKLEMDGSISQTLTTSPGALALALLLILLLLLRSPRVSTKCAHVPPKWAPPQPTNPIRHRPTPSYNGPLWPPAGPPPSFWHPPGASGSVGPGTAGCPPCRSSVKRERRGGLEVS